MDALECRTHLKALIHDVAQFRPLGSHLAVDVVEDDANGHYQIVYRGWERDERVYVVLVHLRLVDDCIFVERDGTADGVATQLLRVGVPYAQIVMAVHPPYLRHLTPFATDG